MAVKTEVSPAQRLESEIKRFILESPANCLKDIDGSPIFDEPLVGFASSADPLFQEYKRIIGDFHLTPLEIMERHLAANGGARLASTNSLSVIVWALPFARKVRLSNRRMTKGPSLHWNHARWLGQALNDNLAQHVVSMLGEQGYQAVAPDQTSFYEIRQIPGTRTSNWSHRHAAYAAGLGTFSLCDGFITPMGIAVRFNSVITDLELPSTLRKYASHIACCPFLVDGSCGACIQRCPVGAISAKGHDKDKCWENLFVTQNSWLEKPGYIGRYAGCGLCLTKVPCEDRIPPMSGFRA